MFFVRFQRFCSVPALRQLENEQHNGSLSAIHIGAYAHAYTKYSLVFCSNSVGADVICIGIDKNKSNGEMFE